jgi:hypothetical protein
VSTFGVNLSRATANKLASKLFETPARRCELLKVFEYTKRTSRNLMQLYDLTSADPGLFLLCMKDISIDGPGKLEDCDRIRASIVFTGRKIFDSVRYEQAHPGNGHFCSFGKNIPGSSRRPSYRVWTTQFFCLTGLAAVQWQFGD